MSEIAADGAFCREPVRPARRLRRAAPYLAVFIVAFAARGLYQLRQADHNPLHDRLVLDAHVNDLTARQILARQAGPEGSYFRPPLYPWLLAAVYAVAGPEPDAGRILGIVLGSLSCVVIALLGTRLGGRPTGFLAGLLAALYWPLIHYDGELLSAGLEVLLNAGLLLAVQQAMETKRGRHWLLAGVLWGLSAITRPNVLVVAPALAWCAWRSRADARRTLRDLGLLGAGAALCIAPVTLRNAWCGREFVLVSANGGVNFYIGNNPETDGTSAVVPGTRKNWAGSYADTHRLASEAAGRALSEKEVSAYWYGQAFRWIQADPGAWARLMLRKLGLFFAPVEIPNTFSARHYARLSGLPLWIGFPIIGVLAGAGLSTLGGGARRWAWLLAFTGLYTASVVLFFCNDRYRLPVLPGLLVLAGAGLHRVAAAWRSRDTRTLGGAVLGMIIAGLVLYLMPPDRREFRTRDEARWTMLLGESYRAGARKDLPEAIRLLERSVELVPEQADARAMLGLALLESKRPVEAVNHFRAALRANPGYAAAHLHYADALVLLEQDELAESEYRAAIQLQPTLAEAHAGLGCMLIRRGRSSEGFESLRRALAIDPSVARAQACMETAGAP